MVVAISWKIRQSRVWKKPIRWPIAVIRRSVTRVQVHWLVRSVVIGRGCLADKLLSKTIISQAERSNWEWNTSTSDIKSIDPVRRTVEEQVSSHAKSISGNSTPRQLDQLLSRVCIFEYLNYRASYNASYKSISHPFRTTLQQLWIFDLPSDGYENDVCVCMCLFVCGTSRAWAIANRDTQPYLCSRDDSQPLSNCSHHSGQIRPPFVHAKHQPGSFDVLDINVYVRVYKRKGEIVDFVLE